MDENRDRLYLYLIQELLRCPNGQEERILAENGELLDAGFAEIVRQMESYLATQAEGGKVEFLLRLAQAIEDPEKKIATTTGNSGVGISSELAAIVKELSQPTPISEMPQRVQLCRQALSLVEQEQNFLLWAALQFELGNSLAQNPLGERAENREKAIAAYQQTLKVINRTVMPLDWAATMNNLAIVYSERIKGERAENLEQAIAAYKQALEVRTRTAMPVDWARIMINLANAYSVRIRGERAENLEQAIAAYKQVLEVTTRTDMPVDWATAMMNLANAYCDRIRGERAENLEQAIAAYKQALEVRTRTDMPVDWATAMMNLASAYSKRINGERAENIEQAIAAYKQALEVRTRTAMPVDWALTMMNLAIAYSERINGERAENIELAIAACKQALEVFTRTAMPVDWARTMNNLATAYLNRIRGERAENLEQAIAAYQQALEERTRTAMTVEWALTMMGLANAYCLRIRGERAENIQQAITYYRNALQVQTKEALPLDCLRTRHGLGNLYFAQENWLPAIESYQIAIEIVEYTRLLSIDENRKQELIAENIKVFANIINCYLQLERSAKAIEYVERSKTRILVESIANYDLYPKGNIPQEILMELDRLRREIIIEQKKLSNQTQIISSNRGLKATQDSQPSENISPVLPDLTHFNQLRQQLDKLIKKEINPIDPEFEFTEKVEPITFQQIQELIDYNTAIIQWYLTRKEIFTFIITKNSNQPLVKRFTSLNEIGDQMINYLNLYRSNNKDWKTQLPSFLRNFAQILHLDEIIASLEKKYSKIILIPHRYLHLLPLHALILDDDRCLLDRFLQVKYAPSCQLLQLAQKRERNYFTNFFAIQNPTQDLIYADLEVQAIQNYFDSANTKVLEKATATKTALDETLLNTVHCSHFSCHGYFNFDEDRANKSALILADAKLKTLPKQLDSEHHLPLAEGTVLDLNKCLTLDALFSLNLEQCRLVILSACETGLIDFKNISDEYIGLVSGFLFAGSPSVVSTLWAVDQVSTAFLLIKFYQNLQNTERKEGDVAVALKNAQNWLRNLTSEEGEKFLETIQPHIDAIFPGKPTKEKIFKNAALQRIRKYGPNPFADPFYWAAFVATGF